MSLGLLVFVVMGKLDQQQVARADLAVHGLQAAFRQKGLCAAARHGMVVHGNTGQKLPQQLAPAHHQGFCRMIGLGGGIAANKDIHGKLSFTT